jgi:DNA (cytosine-5)-methyltransferase 1
MPINSALNTTNPSVIDLFSGAGGMSLGFKDAGFKIRSSIESVAIFSETHKLNFAEGLSITADVSKLKPVDYSREAGIRRGEVSLIIGGPPCQTFSTIGTPKINSVQGKSALLDPRNYYFESFLEYVKFFKPDAFLMENVPQIRTKYEGKLFAQLGERIADYGYEHIYNILNAADYGVPQIRKRLFIAGFRSGLRNRKFSFPKPTHFPETAGVLESLTSFESNYVTVGEAISDLPIISDGNRVDRLAYRNVDRLSDYQLSMRNHEPYVQNNICRVSN